MLWQRISGNQFTVATEIFRGAVKESTLSIYNYKRNTYMYIDLQTAFLFFIIIIIFVLFMP
jgi:hypothetical protein